MNKVVLVLGALTLLVVSGCSSIPPKTASDECLVVIKTEFVNPDSLPRGFELVFNYSMGYKASWIGEYSWDYNLVAIKGPGVEIESIGTRIQANFRGETPEYAVHIPLPYEAGTIVIADFAFVQSIKKTAEHSQSSSFDFRKLTDEEKQDLMKTFSEDPSFASWMK